MIPFIKKLKKKKDLRETFVVGDVHACFKEFLSLLEKVNYKASTHRLILVGDVVNRGPQSLEMLQWIKSHDVELIRGNHEQSFIQGLRKKTSLSSVLVKLKKEMGKDLNQWLVWLEALPFYIEEKDFLVVHAGLVPGEHPKDSDPRLLMNIRTWDGQGEDIKNNLNPAWYSYYKGKKLVIYGHWANQGLKLRKNTIGLDSGCVYGHKLSGVLLPERTVFQVPAIKNYYRDS